MYGLRDIAGTATASKLVGEPSLRSSLVLQTWSSATVTRPSVLSSDHDDTVIVDAAARWTPRRTVVGLSWLDASCGCDES
eukprot:2505221-Prymnesium_polylepis.1